MSNIITVYHGSPKIVGKPQYGVGNPNNDYGLGFYCTESIELAKEWACSAQESGFANRYSLDMTDFSVLSLTGGDYHILNWLYVLLDNRQFRIVGDVAKQAKKYIFEHFAIEYKSYDIIKGYRADDSYFSFANAFLNNSISITQLDYAMRLGKLGEQMVAMSERVFDAFFFECASGAPKEIYYPKKMGRDMAAREAFQKEKDRGVVLNEKYILDIMREGWRDDDERLQRIVLG